MCNDKVSVIMPVYNAEKYINDAIKSILNQTYENIELIIIDDGSTDSSAQLCAKWGRNDSRIRYIRQKNSGVSAARNYGLNVATGKYIMFCDADDWIDQDYINELVLNIPNYDLVISSFQQTTEGGIIERNYKLKKASVSNNKKDFFNDCVNCFIYTYTVWGKLFNRELIGDIRFTPLAYSEDAIFVRSVFARCNSAIFINSKGYHYRVNPNSVTVDTSRIEEKMAGSLGLISYTLIICREEGILDLSKKIEKMLMETLESYLRAAIKNPIRIPKRSIEILNTALNLLHKVDMKYKLKMLVLKKIYMFKYYICPQLEIK